MIKIFLNILLSITLIVICSFILPILTSLLISIITPITFYECTSTPFFWISVMMCAITTIFILSDNIDDLNSDNIYKL